MRRNLHRIVDLFGLGRKRLERLLDRSLSLCTGCRRARVLCRFRRTPRTPKHGRSVERRCSRRAYRADALT
jgi:hypothetical protein